MRVNKTVCICIPCFNNEATIYHTLYSIVNQTYNNIKIKVFDNASTDDSVKMIRNFIRDGYDIEIFENESTTTGEDNFNKCIQYADSDYTAIFHSDDVYDFDIVRNQVELMSNSDCVAVATHSNLIDDSGVLIGQRFIPKELLKSEVSILNNDTLKRYFFKYGNFITCPSVLFDTNVLKNNIQEFRGELFKTSSDFDVWFRLSNIGDFGFIKKPLINYRVSSSSYSFNLSKIRISDHDMFLVLKYHLEMCKFKSYYNNFLDDYDFLLQKDRVKTNINKVLLSNSPLLDVYLPKLNYYSLFHFKFYSIIILYKIMPFKFKLIRFFYKKGV